MPKTNGKWRKKEYKTHRERSPINVGMLGLGEVSFFLFALLVRQENKEAVTKENMQKKKTNSLGQKLNDSKQFTT